MKYLSSWKGMKKSTKIGLAASAVYAATSLALPAYATIVTPAGQYTQQESALKPVDIGDIKTVDQIDKTYSEQIKIGVKDGKLTSQEITGLVKILDQKRHILNHQRRDLREEIHELKAKQSENLEMHTKSLDEEIRTVKDLIYSLYYKRIYALPELEKTKKDFDEEILKYYPSLIERDTNMVYSASDTIEKKLNPIMKGLVLKTNKLLKEYYQDTTLDLLDGKEAYTVKDILTFYKTAHKKRMNICFNSEEIDLKKKNLEKKLEDLENKRTQVIKDYNFRTKTKYQQMDELYKKRSCTQQKILDLQEEYLFFEDYQSAVKNIDKFIAKYGNLNKYMTFSFISVVEGFLEDVGDLGKKKRKFQSKNKSVALGLESYFKAQGFDVEVETLKNPAKTMFPWPWGLNMLFGFLFPTFRNIFTAKLIRREVDDLDFAEGIIEGILFPFALDGICPLLYPIRMFGTPFIMEPLRKFTGWRDLK